MNPPVSDDDENARALRRFEFAASGVRWSGFVLIIGGFFLGPFWLSRLTTSEPIATLLSLVIGVCGLALCVQSENLAEFLERMKNQIIWCIAAAAVGFSLYRAPWDFHTYDQGEVWKTEVRPFWDPPESRKYPAKLRIEILLIEWAAIGATIFVLRKILPEKK
jgi:hypothetical protein